ncbi:MAG: aldose 1-epimerase [Pseudomonas sp.]|uniref:aldose epimerase family protein n=1 Tax=Pseudomonas abieticivorans TaxID=2931382 RepID=UPI0020C083E3|nr:aldose 1-epimerase [Pseudomonas sp. PIA16]MDE1169531.1 aldose 1-epimerase [Pseudomonas sp.]
MTCAPRLTLQNSELTLHLLPAWGGRIERLQVRAHALDLLHPLDATAPFNPLDWPKGGAYPLIPYSNRIAGAQLDFAGQHHVLPHHPQALPHTLHGVSHSQPWQVDDQSSHQARISLDYHGEHWPWPIRAEQHYRLQGHQLLMRLVLTNQGTSAMPGGVGLHPYFQANPGMKVSYRSGRQWQIADDYLATGQCTIGDRDHQWAPQDGLAHTCAQYLSQYGGEVTLDYPQGRLTLIAGQHLDHLVVFAPAGAPYLCIEPVSHLANGFNLAQQLGELSGTQVIEPGASLSTTLCLQWHEPPQQPG